MLRSILFALTLISTNVFSATPDDWVYVNHKYEFDSSENPNKYYWCGHAALSTVAEMESGKTKTMKELHNVFRSNSPNNYAKNNLTPSCKGKWCSSTLDLYWAAHLSKNNGYGLNETVIRNVPKNSSAFLQKIKDAITWNHAAIVASDYGYRSVGHFWIIVGYKDTGNPDTSILFMRDVAREKPEQHWEEEVSVSDFLHDTNHGSGVDILIVKG